MHKKKYCTGMNAMSVASGVYKNTGSVINKIPVGFTESKKTAKGK